MIQCKELKTMAEMEQMQELEGRIWGMTTIPTHQTLTAVKNGGIMVGAYVDDQLVGFSYGFAGFDNGKSYLCSHMLGIEQAYRSQGIGKKLKQKQREIAIRKGYDMMKWTYDPLETRNAYLNLTKLNGICNTYIENCYGNMQDGFNKGLPSDRFEIHWHLKSPYVVEQQPVNTENPTALNTLTFNQEGLPVFTKAKELRKLTEYSYSIHVPKDFQGLKAASQELAMDWRMKTRELFQKLFEADYVAVRLKPHESDGEYIFVKKDNLDLGGKQS
ncbi:GNAT family N-acetyltransferase [Oceanobacillus jeddahense]|uniref:GNAT family N-acetyltransferase n=1 Tax=Oceanobacillus jeddahense TaxID=1462527 RepID=UPI000595CEAA|nr:GNAT family N-acetyltransferase [Oceanobacillus jeddahense]